MFEVGVASDHWPVQPPRRWERSGLYLPRVNAGASICARGAVGAPPTGRREDIPGYSGMGDAEEVAVKTRDRDSSVYYMLRSYRLAQDPAASPDG